MPGASRPPGHGAHCPRTPRAGGRLRKKQTGSVSLVSKSEWNACRDGNAAPVFISFSSTRLQFQFRVSLKTSPTSLVPNQRLLPV